MYEQDDMWVAGHLEEGESNPFAALRNDTTGLNIIIGERPAVRDARPVEPATRMGTDKAFETADDVGKAISAMETRCAEFRRDADARGNTPRTAGDMTPNKDVLYQGDVGVVLLCEKSARDAIAKGKLVQVQGNIKVAVGEGEGSNHTVSSSECQVYEMTESNPLLGPIVVAPNGCTLSHPTHQDVELFPGTYRIVYQRSFAEELRRAQD
jgi:hypothetical protein